MDPQHKKDTSLAKRGEGEYEEQQEAEPLSVIAEEEISHYQWDIEEEETKNHTITYRSSAIRIALDNVMAKVRAI